MAAIPNVRARILTIALSLVQPGNMESPPRHSAEIKEPPSRRTLLWQRVVLAALKGATGAIQGVSRPAALRFGARLGMVAFSLDRRRRHYAESNIRLAFGGRLTDSERRSLVRGTFAHWGKSTVEFLRVPGLQPETMAELATTVEGWEWVESARAAGNGFIIVTGHLGNFEFLGRWMASQGVPSTVIVREPADPGLAAYLRSIREFGGNVALGKGAASVRALLTLLKKGQTITLGVDQNSGDIIAPFFGVPTGTVAGPALLALRTGAPLLPAFCVLEPDNSYRMIFLPPITAINTGDRDADVVRTMTEINSILEGVIRRYPEQWLWLHNRWKSVFEEKNRQRWPAGYDYEASKSLWQQY